jgi:CxxC-x17-CxxC domain-containing protein
MHQGNWTCSGCGTAITELPFEPKRTDGLLCRECHQKQKGSAAPRKAEGDRPRFEGDWKCSSCGVSITSLPFEPRDTTNLLCVDCYKKRKG